jgi:hypothetical protein
MAFVSSVTYGRDSRLFVWLWSHWPFFSRLRVWGRMNVILLLPLAWLLAAAYSWWEGWLERPKSLRGKRDWLVVATLCAGYLAALGAQTWMLRHQIFNSYWKIWFPHLWGLESSFVRTGFLSFCALAIPALLSFGKGLSGLQASMAAAALIVATGADIYPIGSRVWITYSPPPRRARLDLEAQYRQSFAVCRKDEPPGTVTLSPAFNAWVVPNWDYHRYVEFRSHAAAERDAEGELLGITGCRKIFQTADVRHPQIRSFLEDAAGFGGTFRLVDYDGDLLRLKVAMPRPGHVSFIDNWDPGWRALVDGESRPIELLYGTFKSVSVGAGEHEVVFVYRPSLSGRGASGLLR